MRPTFQRYVNQSPAPAVTARTGTLTSASATMRWRREGPDVVGTVTATITTNGTGAQAIRIALPVVAAASGDWSPWGREVAVTGKGLTGVIYAGTNVLELVFIDNGYPGANGAILQVNFRYEAGV